MSPSPPPRSAAILIGTGRYEHPGWNGDLPQVAHNVSALRAVLSDPTLSLFDGPTAVLLDADRDEVDHRLGEVGGATTGTLLIYLAGRAQRTDDRLHLALPAAAPGHLHREGLDVSAVLRAAHGTGAPRVALVVDCCHSGAGMGRLALGLPRSTAILAGGFADDPVPAGASGACTPFTADLVRVLRCGLPDADELLRIDQIQRELVVRAAARDRPTPHLAYGEGTVPHLARNAAFGGPPPEAAADRLRWLEHRYLVSRRRYGMSGQTLDRLRALAFWTAEDGAASRALVLYRELVDAESRAAVEPLSALVSRYRRAVLAAETGTTVRGWDAVTELRMVVAALRSGFPDHPETVFAAADLARLAGPHGRTGCMPPPEGEE